MQQHTSPTAPQSATDGKVLPHCSTVPGLSPILAQLAGYCSPQISPCSIGPILPLLLSFLHEELLCAHRP
ncbi:MAG: hypothetical protein A2710_26415 [Burkholderiales bacterium RIFCSPHIGHO2_01_FULL_64_960]|nr:MAG: hypothetical protein A2710_26415 [Burkholderiales bacterium RIFCSPHIGHO2_01_FULL_64_960]